MLLGRYDEDTGLVSAGRAGAFGCIPKDTDQTEFLHIIRAAAQGEQVPSAVVLHPLAYAVPGTVRQTREHNTALLMTPTDREREILASAAMDREQQGYRGPLMRLAQIVKTHLRRIHQTLSVSKHVETF